MGLPEKWQQKLIDAGLMKGSGKKDVLLGDCLDSMKGSAVKISTRLTYNNAMNNLIAHFGRPRRLTVSVRCPKRPSAGG